MKKVLIIVPYSYVYPPMNGGMQRCFHIVHQLALYFDVSLITFQPHDEFMMAAINYPAILQIKIFSTKDHPQKKGILSLFPKKLQNALRYRWIQKNIRSPADGMFLEYYPLLKELLKRKKFDAIILENLSTLNAVKLIRNYQPFVKNIYDAHNVDSNLAKGKPDEQRIRKIESSLHHEIDALLVCSDNDRIAFEKLNEKPINVVVIPNGVDVSEMISETSSENENDFILFCGSLGEYPNSEGLVWFYKNIWKQLQVSLPHIKLLVVGSGELPSEAWLLHHDSSILFSGAVEDVKPWYKKAKVAIVPLLSGSGTRLKIMEAMSLQVPVVSTTKGAEGIDYSDGENILIANEPQLFKQRIIDLLMEPAKRMQIQKEARKLVEEKYDWNKIGIKMKDFLLMNVLANGD